MSRTVPSPKGQSTLRHSSSSGARSRIECRGPAPRDGPAPSMWLFFSIRRTPPSGCRLSCGVFFLGRARTGKEAIGAQEAPFKSPAECRPIPFSLIGIERGADRAHLGIEVVQIMQQQGFAEHGKLRRTKFILPVMGNQYVLHKGFQRGRKSLN